MPMPDAVRPFWLLPPATVYAVVQRVPPGSLSVTEQVEPSGMSLIFFEPPSTREKVRSSPAVLPLRSTLPQSTVNEKLSPAAPPTTVFETVRDPQLVTSTGNGRMRSFTWFSNDEDDARLFSMALEN